MPHVIYLHSALTKGRMPVRDDAERRRVLRFERIDVMIALGLAGLRVTRRRRRARSSLRAGRRGTGVPRTAASAAATSTRALRVPRLGPLSSTPSRVTVSMRQTATCTATTGSIPPKSRASES